MTSDRRFPEDDLPLLARPLTSLSPQEFRIHVLSLSLHARPKPAKGLSKKIKGKTLRAPKKTTPGLYQMELAVMGTRSEFEFDKSKIISPAEFERVLAELQCPELQLREYFVIKKFSVDTSLEAK